MSRDSLSPRDAPLAQVIAEAIAEAEGIPWRNRADRQQDRLLKNARAAIRAYQKFMNGDTRGEANPSISGSGE